LPRFIFSN